MKRQLKDFFIPHKGNDYAPHSLQKTALLLMSVLVLITFAMSSLQSVLWTTSEWLVSTVLPAVIVELTNDERADGALGTLRRSTTLDQAATRKAQHMAANQYFSHYAPDGTSPWYWFGTVNYSFVHAGENLAIHFSDSGQVVEAWMNSPTHRANILNGQYTEIGVGTAQGTYDGFPTVYVVQLFGTPVVAAAAANELESPIVAGATAPREPESPVDVVATEVDTEEPAAPDEVVLADEVAVTEFQERAQPAERTEMATDSDSVAEDVGTVEVAEVIVDDKTVSLYSSHMATTVSSTALAAVEPAPSDTSTVSVTTPGWWSLTTQPQRVLQGAYLGLAGLVVMMLLFAVLVEIRRQQPVQVAYALLLLFMMAGLWQLHSVLTSTVIIV